MGSRIKKNDGHILTKAFVKCRTGSLNVIPAKTGTNYDQTLLNSGLRRNDENYDVLRYHHKKARSHRLVRQALK